MMVRPRISLGSALAVFRRRYFLWNAILPTAVAVFVLSLNCNSQATERETASPPGASAAARANERTALLAQLLHASAARRREAILRLCDLDMSAEELLPRIEPLLDDRDATVRAQAARGVWLVGRRADLAVETLGALVESADPNVCALAAFLLGEMGPPARDAVPILESRLTERDPLVRLHAAEAIVKIDAGHSESHLVLLRALHDRSSDVRYFAACALLTAGAPYRDRVRGALLGALSDDDLRVASAAALSFEHWRPPASAGPQDGDDTSSVPSAAELARLISNLSDASATVRRQAALRLAERGQHAQPAVRPLRRLLADDDPAVRVYAAYALWQIERDVQPILPTLVDLLGTIRPNVTTLATCVLAQLGAEGADALPALYDILETSDRLVRLHVAIAISRIDPRSRDSVTILVRALHERDSDLRYLGALALGHVSPLSRIRAKRELTYALGDRNLRVRAAATIALQTLDEAVARNRRGYEAAEGAAVSVVSEVARSDRGLSGDRGPAGVAFVNDGQREGESAIPAADPIPPLPGGEVREPGSFDVDEVTTEERKSIGQLEARITPSEGDLPIDHAAQHFALVPQYNHGYGTSRGWYGLGYAWNNPGVGHQPLYFQDLNLERYGYHFGCFQTVVSSAKFCADAALLPYKMVVTNPCECVYTLGYDRPGNCVPYRCYRLPWRTDAALVLAGVATGLVFLAP